MTEPAVNLRSVPVLDLGRNLDDVTRPQALGGLAPLLVPTLAINADEHLPAPCGSVVDVPVVAATRFEGHVVDGNGIIWRRKRL